MVSCYFIQRALSWLSPHSVALRNPPFTKEALKSLSSLPEEVSVENLLLTITRGKGKRGKLGHGKTGKRHFRLGRLCWLNRPFSQTAAGLRIDRDDAICNLIGRAV